MPGKSVIPSQSSRPDIRKKNNGRSHQESKTTATNPNDFRGKTQQEVALDRNFFSLIVNGVPCSFSLIKKDNHHVVMYARQFNQGHGREQKF
ncbi:hypothetical protein CEXT_512081 [Caerostris extrusa]|uniref:Uncharacterized protein n=1 Tax=Caerostris extrusa TaxID=172846 RepID=A0AAV4X9T7_CAEEX|nr:hypothetical protein CEXT_512081 [Caerostris extrusa]